MQFERMERSSYLRHTNIHIRRTKMSSKKPLAVEGEYMHHPLYKFHRNSLFGSDALIRMALAKAGFFTDPGSKAGMSG